MSGISLKPPKDLNLDNVDIDFFKIWLQAFEDYCSLSHPKIDEEDKCKLFLTVAGLPTRSLLSKLGTDITKFANISDSLKNHIQPVKSVVFERHKFFTARQLANESISQFVSRLRGLASACDFEDTKVDSVKNQLIRDQFIVGVSNTKITENLLEAGDINLENALNKASSIDQAAKDVIEISGNVNSALFAVTNQQQRSSLKDVRCFRCQSLGHMIRDCPKPPTVCTYCRKRGHLQEKCFKKVNDSKKMFTVAGNQGELPHVLAKLNGTTVRFLIDTGSSLSVLSNRLINRLGLQKDLQSNETKTAVSACGSEIRLGHHVICDFSFNAYSHATTFFVGNIVPEAILGMDLLRLLPFTLHLAEETIFAVEDNNNNLLSEFNDIFDKSLKDSCLKDYEPCEVIPIRSERPYRAPVRQFSRSDRDFISQKISELRNEGIIEPSHGPWRCVPVIVGKKDGSKRMTINYKPVNSQTVFDAYPLPIIDELIAQLNDAKVFSKLDFSQFYHQIPLKNSDRPKTAFFAEGQLWQYTRLPFGLRNAVAHCSRIMHSIFKDIPGCLVYLDDLLIFGKDQNEHDKVLRRVLDKIRENGLGLNRKKCSFGLRQVDFLGISIMNGSIRPTEDRLTGLISFPLPNDLQSLERFIGMATYFSKFIEFFSESAKPLFNLKNDLLECGDRRSNPRIDFWPKSAIHSFNHIKNALQNAVLTLPGPNETLVLRTDASNDCIAGVIETSSGQPVSFLSRKLTKSEQNYDIVEKEALAIFWSIMKSKLFLLGRQFKVYSDHQSLKFLFNSDKTTPKIIRWRLALQPFDFSVEYCPGKNNAVADCLSRINSLESQASTNFDFESILQSQELDEETQALISCIKNTSSKKPSLVSPNLWAMRKTLKLEHGHLYNKNGLLFVPYKSRLRLLTLCHGLHRGISSTYNCLRENFFWPRDYKEVTTFVKDCRICSLIRPQFISAPNVPLITKAPMEIIALDFVGPLPSSSGYKYFLTAVDLYSRYAFVEPTHNLSTASLISACKNIFAMCGFPNFILSDRGAQFCSDDFRAFLRNFNVKWMTTCAYSPKSNGCSERFNGTIQRSIFAYLTQKGLSKFQWIYALPAALLNYRTSVHASTGCRPVDLFFNFRAVGLTPHNFNSTTSKDHLYRKLNERQRRKYGKNIVNRCKFSLKPGDVVLIRKPGKSKFSNFKSKFSDHGRVALIISPPSSFSVSVKYLDNNLIDNVHLDRVSLVSTGGGYEECGSPVIPDLSSIPDTADDDRSSTSSASSYPGRLAAETSHDYTSSTTSPHVGLQRRVQPPRNRRPPEFYGNVVSH